MSLRDMDVRIHEIPTQDPRIYYVDEAAGLDHAKGAEDAEKRLDSESVKARYAVARRDQDDVGHRLIYCRASQRVQARSHNIS
jgi:hypothetical protein